MKANTALPGTISVGVERFFMSLTFRCQSFPAGVRSLLHVGNTNNNRMPLIFLAGDSFLGITMSRNGHINGWGGNYPQILKGGDLKPNVDIHLNLYLSGSYDVILAYVAGVEKYRTRNDHNSFVFDKVGTPQTVYLSDPWYGAADCTVSELQMEWDGHMCYAPTTTRPTTAQPTTAQPTTAHPTTAQPTTAVPTAPIASFVVF